MASADRSTRNFRPYGVVINVVLASTGTFKDGEKSRDVAMRALALETTISYVASVRTMTGTSASTGSCTTPRRSG
ncbi:hypothetical protein SALBM311S_10785 [Streptomyces alboniger]